MQIVIDIPEEVIEVAKSSPNYYPTYHFEKIWRAIANGTPLNDVLNKIRDGIEEQKTERCFDDDDMFVYRTGLDDALYIIDKYTAESEE